MTHSTVSEDESAESRVTDTTWTTAETYGIGTACDHGSPDPSRVWFTLTEGALTEPRFPRIDLMNLRTLDFFVVDSDTGYAARTYNETRTDDEVETLDRTTVMSETVAPVYRQRITETGDDRGWELTVEYVTGTDHETLLLDVCFDATDDYTYDVYVAADVALSGYLAGTAARRITEPDGYALTAREVGSDDDPVVVDENGAPYEVATAVVSGTSFDWASSYTAEEARFEELFGGAEPETDNQRAVGHTLLVGRIGTDTRRVEDEIAVGFAESGDTESAYDEAIGTLTRGFDRVRDSYVSGWEEYVDQRELPESVRGDTALENQYRAAMMVLKAVEDKTFLGAGIASPSVPWGDAVDASKPGDYGYNFTWSRDLYQVFTALSALDDVESARLAVEYLYEYQQRENGFLPQNTHLDGRTRWGGEQLDNIAYPSVMAYQLDRNHDIGFDDVSYDYEDVRRSIEYILRSGPDSEQERWEEEAGYSPSTIAAEVAGLGCGAALADDVGQWADALVYLAYADYWRLAVDEWCATTEGTGEGRPTPYYIRVSRNGNPDSGVERTLANNGPTLDEREIIDAGFLELVRLGLRDPTEEIIQNSLSVVDDTIRVETPNGPGWYRYNGDGYGELGTESDDEGGPWPAGPNGSGRLWPIFTGERGEYELLANEGSGDLDPGELLNTMQRFANDGRMIPEQVWDRAYPSAYGWEFGEGTGSATPLAWSMAQFIRLAHAIDAGEPVETPAILARRYADGAPDGPELGIHTVDDADGTVTVTGETDGDQVVIWTPDRTEQVQTTDGAFEIQVPANTESCTVISGTSADDVHRVGVTLEEVGW